MNLLILILTLVSTLGGISIGLILPLIYKPLRDELQYNQNEIEDINNSLCDDKIELKAICYKLFLLCESDDLNMVKWCKLLEECRKQFKKYD